MDEYSERWNEICFLLSENINNTPSEKEFENQVVRAMEVLGWREFKKEIKRQPTIQLGREGTLRPDIIIEHVEKTIIVIEVKRPQEDITRDYVIGQLRSYMRQMKSDFGFLIGSDLRIFYDGHLNPYSDPILLEKIAFKRGSEKGILFVKNFNKKSIAEKTHLEYLRNRLDKFNKQREISALVEQLTSFEIKQKIIGFLRNEFQETDDETFSEALQQIKIEISKKVTQSIDNTKKKTIKPGGEETSYSQPRKNNKSQSFYMSSVNIADLPFESHRSIRLKHIYGVIYFMKQGSDFPSAVKQTLQLFPEVQDYQTISDKCARGFAGNVDTFISWFQSGQMLEKLQVQEKFGLSKHDYNIFKQLLLS